jgi:hypothetical protein
MTGKRERYCRSHKPPGTGLWRACVRLWRCFFAVAFPMALSVPLPVKYLLRRRALLLLEVPGSCVAMKLSRGVPSAYQPSHFLYR